MTPLGEQRRLEHPHAKTSDVGTGQGERGEEQPGEVPLPNPVDQDHCRQEHRHRQSPGCTPQEMTFTPVLGRLALFWFRLTSYE